MQQKQLVLYSCKKEGPQKQKEYVIVRFPGLGKDFYGNTLIRQSFHYELKKKVMFSPQETKASICIAIELECLCHFLSHRKKMAFQLSISTNLNSKHNHVGEFIRVGGNLQILP